MYSHTESRDLETAGQAKSFSMSINNMYDKIDIHQKARLQPLRDSTEHARKQNSRGIALQLSWLFLGNGDYFN